MCGLREMFNSMPYECGHDRQFKKTLKWNRVYSVLKVPGCMSHQSIIHITG